MRVIAIASVLLLAACAASEPESRSESTTPAGGSGTLDNTAVDVGMERVRPIVTSCLGPGRTGTTWNVRLTIRNDGHPTDVRVESETEDPTIAACLEGAISGAVFPPFSGPPVTVTYPFYVH
jgi:hypothetical protein